MIRVIKKGEPKKVELKKLIYKGICHHCNSVLEADGIDVNNCIIGSFYDRRGSEYIGMVICPVCNTSTFVRTTILD